MIWRIGTKYSTITLLTKAVILWKSFFFNQEHVKEDVHYLTCFLAGDPNLGLEGAALLEAVFIHVRE